MDGIYRTVAWVVAVMLPPMAIFFPLFTLLEDAGYLPRVAFCMDRCFRAAGACGRQSLTMAMGFGCNACVNICQVDILIPSPEKGKHPIVLYPGECYYCGACVMACPHDGAIRLEHPLMNRAKFVPVRCPEEK